jgi:tetratricopeptide (TPR) repeat protein
VKYKFHIRLCKACFCTIIGISSILCMPYFASHTQASEQIKFPPPSADKLFDQGLEYYNQQKLDEAIENFNQAINLDNNYDLAYYMRGLAYYDKGNISEATKNITKAIQINPEVWLYILNTSDRGYDIGEAKKKYTELWDRFKKENKLKYLEQARALFVKAYNNTQDPEKKTAKKCKDDVQQLINIYRNSPKNPRKPNPDCISD